MVSSSELALFLRTASHLHASQVTQRARLRTQRALLRHCPPIRRLLLSGPHPAAAVGWPLEFEPIDAQVWQFWPGLDELRAGRIKLLGTTRTLAEPCADGQVHRAQDDPGNADWTSTDLAQSDWEQANWSQAAAPQLWRFHLHYWDWAWSLAAEPDRVDGQAMFATLWRSWRAAVDVGRGDAWLTYPAALRAWSWCGIFRYLVAGGEIESEFIAEMTAHTGFLRRHLELDIGGNHLIKDLKAVVGLAVFFADDRLLEQGLRRLMAQLAVQVLPDGGHYERAPAYHCQVLGDLIDVAGLIQATGRILEPELPDAIRRMRDWLGCVLSPDGQVPLLNDGYPVDAAMLAALRPNMSLKRPLIVLPDTGLARATVGAWDLLVDIGLPCPAELPGHAHADTFGCIVHVDGQPLLVDTATSTYSPGSQRSFERSTAAHNTVELDGTNSTEVWGAFRAARRARVLDLETHADNGVITIAATHDGFRALRGHPHHRRRWSLTKWGLQVDDLITGRGRHSAVLRWHFAPGSALQLSAEGVVATTPIGDFRVIVTANGPVTLIAEKAPVARGFCRIIDGPVLTCSISAALPLRISTSWRRTEGDQAAGDPAESHRIRDAGMSEMQKRADEQASTIGGIK